MLAYKSFSELVCLEVVLTGLQLGQIDLVKHVRNCLWCRSFPTFPAPMLDKHDKTIVDSLDLGIVSAVLF